MMSRLTNIAGKIQVLCGVFFPRYLVLFQSLVLLSWPCSESESTKNQAPPPSLFQIREAGRKETGKIKASVYSMTNVDQIKLCPALSTTSINIFFYFL